MSLLSRVNPTKEAAHSVYEKPGRPKAQQRSKGNKNRVGIQSALPEIKCKKKDHFAIVSAKPNQRNQELIRYKKNNKPMGSKLIMHSGSLYIANELKSSQICLSCRWVE